MNGDKEGKYCWICSGIPPDRDNHMDDACRRQGDGHRPAGPYPPDVSAFHLDDPVEIRAELMKRARVFNYFPTKKTDAYADALMEEYRQFNKGTLKRFR